LTYVTNSPAAFLVGAEEIVYLKDIGVSSAIITSMMQRDQALKTVWGMNDQPAAVIPLTNSVAMSAAPTYVNSPQAAPVAEPQPAEVTDDYFYDTLTPYGTWVATDYGQCWRPTMVVCNPGWRPYCDGGRWVYSNAGWYWMSDYSWGSVTFRYGRWFNDPRQGWCWWPDRVWGPSWVTWRYDNYNCGWAPLPPNSIYTPGVGLTYFGTSVGPSYGFSFGVGAYTFVPWNRFCDPYPYRHCLPQSQVVGIYGQTTIVNNYGNGNNTTVINRGISPDRVQEHARTEVRTVTLRTESTRSASPRADRLEGGGRTLVVNRPPSFQSGVGATTATSSSVIGNPRVSAPRGEVATGRNETGRPTRPASAVNQSSGGAFAPVTSAGSGRNSSIITTTPNASGGGRAATPRSQGSASVVRSTTTTAPATPTPVTRPTPIFSQPITVDRRSTPGTTANQPIIVGGDRNSRSTGRDYSVWGTPNPRPPQNSITPPAAPTTFNGGQTIGGSSSPNTILPPRSTNPSRPQNNNQQRELLAERSQAMERNSRARFEERSAAQNYSAPTVLAPRSSAPVIINPTPSPAPSARPTFTPVPSAPRVVAPAAAPSRNGADSGANSGGGNSGRPGGR